MCDDRTSVLELAIKSGLFGALRLDSPELANQAGLAGEGYLLLTAPIALVSIMLKQLTAISTGDTVVGILISDVYRGLSEWVLNPAVWEKLSCALFALRLWVLTRYPIADLQTLLFCGARMSSGHSFPQLVLTSDVKWSASFTELKAHDWTNARDHGMRAVVQAATSGHNEKLKVVDLSDPSEAVYLYMGRESPFDALMKFPGKEKPIAVWMDASFTYPQSTNANVPATKTDRSFAQKADNIDQWYPQWENWFLLLATGMQVSGREGDACARANVDVLCRCSVECETEQRAAHRCCPRIVKRHDSLAVVLFAGANGVVASATGLSSRIC